MSRLQEVVARRLAARGFELRRHPAVRRQAALAAADVDLVLDVGAAGGGYGSQLRQFGYTGRILSFEPLEHAHARLTETAATDDRWDVVRTALGSEPSTATINVASNSDSSSLLPMLPAHVDAAPEVTYVRQETVEVARLDDVMAGRPEAARPFLKIDTQGYEREVLGGAEATLARCVGLQLELSFVPLYEGGMLVDEAVAWAYERGFHLVSVEQGYAAPGGQILQLDGVFLRS